MSSTSTILLVVALFLAFLYGTAESQDPFAVQAPPRASKERVTPSNILLLTAHPDDECMFFGPTLSALIAQGHDVYSICLSTGNQDGLGPIREKELERSLDVFGVRKANRRIEDHPALRDNITVLWKDEVIDGVVSSFVEKNISMILTFDDHGVSGHPNHKALPAAMRYLAAAYPSGREIPRIFVLNTTLLGFKYTGPIAPLAAKLVVQISRTLPSELFSSARRTVFVAGIREYLTSLRAMRQHRIQLVWFRWLYVVSSRYMWANGWEEMSAEVKSSLGPT